ncbi:sulfhydryl oxidase 2 [Gadus morhua]|uniref:sulfhydryl oxidase 2 n=1 Tax=Gadus morhua TaxID=8049 RepID=UPI0011B4AD97|nr:sulfhydryl oxidase 2 [Gadus morhua]
MAGGFLLSVVVLCFLTCGAAAGTARLYTEDDPLVLLGSGSLKRSVSSNSSSAWLVQFYSSWCGHCIQFSSTWKALAHDVQDWDTIIHIAVVDCAQDDNFDICKEYGVSFYPTFRYFGAHASPADLGKTYRGADRGVQTLRELMINFLQNHTRLGKPDHCPPLEPFNLRDLLPLLGQKSAHYTAIIIEHPTSYVGREVILDLSKYTGIVVRRALSTDTPLVDKLKITAFPSAYLLHPNGTHTHLHLYMQLRFFFTSFLRGLQGVQRRQTKDHSAPNHMGALSEHHSTDPWREFDSSKVYMADLESALHYLLRVELATHNTLGGEELKTFKSVVTVIAKLYPGRASVQKVMENLLDWLVRLPLESIPYQAILDLVDDKMRISSLSLGAEVRWVGCQGSRPGLRGYPCSLWTLFHMLTVQYDASPKLLAGTALEGDPAAVLNAMRGYIGTFFGCEQCGRHFEEMAAQSLDQVKTTEDAVIWLWSKHNQVNSRLAGSLSDDPVFPKSPWPSPALCPACHQEKEGVHTWNEEQVLAFLRQHYGAGNLSPRYLPEPQRHLPTPPLAPPQAPQKPQGAVQALQQQQQQQQQQQPTPRATAVVLNGGGAKGAQIRLHSGSGGWILGFTSVDMSLCLVLYVCSCLMLMLLFFFFKIRSRRWKLKNGRLHV